MRVYFATNRCPDDPANPTEFLDHACGEDPQNLRFGVAEVDLKRRSVDFTVAPESNVGDPDRQVLGSLAVFDRLRQDMIDDPADCLFFIHGFANTFELALIRAATIGRFYFGKGSGPLSKKLHLFAFCWPSDGVAFSLMNAYRSDRIDAMLSGPAIGRTILKALDFVAGLPPDERCHRRIHLLAHSMGNWALRHALQHIQEQSPRGPRIVFDQAILAAADEDADALESTMKLGYLAQLSRRITVYINFQDVVLHVSDWTKGNPDRLGKSGPRHPNRIPNNATVVNCSKVITQKNVTDPEDVELGDANETTHQYYRNDETVRRDIVRVLKGISDDLIENRRWVPEKRYYTLEEIAREPSSRPRRGSGRRRGVHRNA
ncbi:MAG TPA: alpha/beta hydrolase [Alphaproteobacteria bacterium]|nr:alpha/beta hydrolase [Alphaproteobacteria bacterium]